MHERAARLVLAGRYVELKAVPGAGDDAAGESALAERAALMGADAVEGMERAAHVEQGNDPLAGDELTAAAFGHVAHRSNANPLGHAGSILDRHC